jgi:predicted RNA-binding Zn-ribbon protein involved in translation (DUF1610 family)
MYRGCSAISAIALKCPNCGTREIGLSKQETTENFGKNREIEECKK